jgi:hypothetical protein
MGNIVTKICGFNGEGDKSNQMNLDHTDDNETMTFEKIKAGYEPKEEGEKIVRIQTNVRQYSAKQKFNRLLKEKNQKEFEENTTSVGSEISEEEMDRKISEKVKEIEQTISPFEPTKEELIQFKDTFVKGPILFEDGSIYKGSWYSMNIRKGFGVFINPQGYKYEGFWKNEKLNGRGRFIDDKANYYEGKL